MVPHGAVAVTHRGPCQVRLPAEVDVLTEERDGFAEPPDGLEEVGPDQHTGIGHREQLARGVVLGLIQFAVVDQLARRTEAIDGKTDREEAVAFESVAQLRTHDPRVRPERLGHELGHRIRLQNHIVVTDQQERRPLYRAGRLVHGGGEPMVLGEPLHERERGHVRDPFGGIGLAGVVDHQDRELRVVLGLQRRERFGEPVPRVLGDHDRHHRRSPVATDDTGGSLIITEIGDHSTGGTGFGWSSIRYSGTGHPSRCTRSATGVANCHSAAATRRIGPPGHAGITDAIPLGDRFA